MHDLNTENTAMTANADEIQKKNDRSVLHVCSENTLYAVLQSGEQYLQGCGIEDASVDAWLLMEYVTGIRRTMFLIERRNLMKEEEQQRYFELIKKRGTHIPLQHLTGEQEFMGLTFKVNEHVLIPRQDTEILVEEALKRVRPGMKVLDMCTGSGCIAVSIAKLAGEQPQMRMQMDAGNIPGTNASGKGSESGLQVDASDISENALAVAKQNITALEADVTLIHSDLFEQIAGAYDIIVSNPPYIRTSVIEELAEEVKIHDPFLALDGKEDGLYFYRRIVEKSPEYLNAGGYLLFEIGHDQGNDVKELMCERGFEDVQVYKDLAGLNRVVTGQWNRS